MSAESASSRQGGKDQSGWSKGSAGQELNMTHLDCHPQHNHLTSCLEEEAITAVVTQLLPPN